MTANEFKAWLDGYKAANGKRKLTEKQLAEIVEKLEEIQPEPCHLQHYYWPWWPNWTVSSPTVTIYGGSNGTEWETNADSFTVPAFPTFTAGGN